MAISWGVTCRNINSLLLIIPASMWDFQRVQEWGHGKHSWSHTVWFPAYRLPCFTTELPIPTVVAQQKLLVDCLAIMLRIVLPISEVSAEYNIFSLDLTSDHSLHENTGEESILHRTHPYHTLAADLLACLTTTSLANKAITLQEITDRSVVFRS